MVQHISTFSRPEVAAPGPTPSPRSGPSAACAHQLSYTLPLVHPTRRTGTGVGDVALNYRYQLVASTSANGVTAVHAPLAPH